MNKKIKHKVAILGCGNIGALYDIQRNLKKSPLSHLRGYFENPNFEICSVIDNDEKKLENVKNKWFIKNTFKSLKEFKNSNPKIDVVSICTPTFCHYDHLKEIIELKPKLIFCEKPLTENFLKSQEITSLCKKKNIILVVNFLRRWDPFIKNFKKEIQNLKYGDLKAVYVKANNGIINYGCHAIDLLFFLFDEISEKSIKFSLISKNEINFSFFLQKKQTSVNLSLNNDKSFSLFEFEFIFTNFIITMFNGGREWGFRKIIRDKDFYNNYYLSNFKYKKGKILDTMPIIIKDIHKILKEGSKPKSDGLTSLKSQKICDLILEKQIKS